MNRSYGCKRRLRHGHCPEMMVIVLVLIAIIVGCFASLVLQGFNAVQTPGIESDLTERVQKTSAELGEKFLADNSIKTELQDLAELQEKVTVENQIYQKNLVEHRQEVQRRREEYRNNPTVENADEINSLSEELSKHWKLKRLEDRLTKSVESITKRWHDFFAAVWNLENEDAKANYGKVTRNLKSGWVEEEISVQIPTYQLTE